MFLIRKKRVVTELRLILKALQPLNLFNRDFPVASKGPKPNQVHQDKDGEGVGEQGRGLFFDWGELPLWVSTLTCF